MRIAVEFIDTRRGNAQVAIVGDAFADQAIEDGVVKRGPPGGGCAEAALGPSSNR